MTNHMTTEDHMGTFLKVMVIGVILYQPTDVIHVDSGTIAELSCLSNQLLEAGSLVSWYRRSWTTGQNISLVKSCVHNDNNKYICRNEDYKAKLQIRNTQTRDSGVYFCAYYYYSTYNISNGTILIVRERSTPYNVHLLAQLQTILPNRMVQLACVVHEVPHLVYVTWNIFGTNVMGKMTSTQASDGTWTTMNIILLPEYTLTHEDKVMCEVWYRSNHIQLHWNKPVSVAEQPLVSTCSWYWKSVLTAIVLVIFLIAIHLSNTCI
ncbi:uncharacterized protein LOC130283328 isoform X2 [Hyla sarda]|uniref:uncharacterized protein LOC130283328 isoform X2 n=1 Tax=Hyla sarda TaxID=327740 RepID=UPI0024C46FCE|nr:uncharacterized protein LOC130283328 isoform X2 [Hyla sarda]